MSKHIPGGEVTMHPGPKNASQGVKMQHGSHDVKGGFGGNDVIIQNAPKRNDDNPLGHHNTEVQSQPGNTVQISNARADSNQDDDLEPPTLPPVEESEEALFERICKLSRPELDNMAEQMGCTHSPMMPFDILAESITYAIINEKEEGE